MRYRVALHEEAGCPWFNLVETEIQMLKEELYSTFVRWTGPWVEIEV